MGILVNFAENGVILGQIMPKSPLLRGSKIMITLTMNIRKSDLVNFAEIRPKTG